MEWAPLTPGVGYQAPGVVTQTEEAPFRNPYSKTIYRNPYNKDMVAAVEYDELAPQSEEAEVIPQDTTMTIKVQSEQQPIMNAYATSKTLYRDPYNKDTIAAVGYSTANQQAVSHTVAIPYRNPATKVVYRDPYKKDMIAAVEYSSLEVQNEEAIPAEETAEDSLPQKTVTHKIEINYDEIPYRNPYSKGTEQAQQKTVMNMKITGYAQQYCENLGDMSPPDTSNCWQWNVPEVNFGEQKGCDYDKCAAAVCECDPFCCSDSWDLSCRGYKESPTDLFKDNPFNPGCSASILCCEQEEAVPDPPVVANCATAGWMPPDDSTCWQWNKQGSSPQVQIGNQKGCTTSR